MRSKYAQESYDFFLPSKLNASVPPERRGIRRDQVRMMVLNRIDGNMKHDYFNQLSDYINPGDMVVLNSSRTIPGVIKGDWSRNGKLMKEKIEIRLARKKNSSTWETLILAEGVKAGDEFTFSEKLQGKVIGEVFKSPLKIMHFTLRNLELMEAIYTIGEPVRYEYIDYPWTLDYYQTVFGSQPGSIEMPSAGRAFSWELLFSLQEKGVKLGYIQLHTGLSYLLDDEYSHSPEDHHEEYFIPEECMKNIQETKAAGGKIIAVGTTVVRALETAAANSCLSGWTNLYVNSAFQLQLTDGIITGFHEPKASHLDMLTAFIPEAKLFTAYDEAIKMEYLWHEFGDMNLII